MFKLLTLGAYTRISTSVASIKLSCVVGFQCQSCGVRSLDVFHRASLPRQMYRAVICRPTGFVSEEDCSQAVFLLFLNGQEKNLIRLHLGYKTIIMAN